MRNQKLIVVFLVLAIPVGIFLFRKHLNNPAGSKNMLDTTLDEPLLATYDRSQDPRHHFLTSMEHISLALDESGGPDFFMKFAKVLSAQANVMVTVKLSGSPGGGVLSAVREGVFDDTFALLFETLKKHKQTVLVRLNPEMEVPVKTYPWQYQSSADYVEAYLHFARRSKAASPAIRLVWGPAGYPGTEEYYPGDEFVDAISITLQSESEKLVDVYPPYPDLQTAVKRKLHRLRFMDKPVLILGRNKMKTDSSVLNAIENGLSQVRKEQVTIYSTALFKNRGKIPNRISKAILGVYDPKLLLTGSEAVRAEHIFIDITQIQNGHFEKDFNAILGRKHDVIVSFEPWRDQKVRVDTNVLLNTIRGVYDREFHELYRVLKTTDRTVYLRFAHEMEMPIHRYAWQSQDPVLYIKAFRYFMEFDESCSNVMRVWGPAGDRGAMEWWPGEDVVDFVSIAIFALPGKNITDPKKQEPFRAIYERKFPRIHFAGKPVLVTEFGVKGPEDFKRQWLYDAAGVIEKHKEISGVSYFNLADNPEVWGDIPAPDWSITRATFEKFVEKLSDQ